MDTSSQVIDERVKRDFFGSSLGDSKSDSSKEVISQTVPRRPGHHGPERAPIVQVIGCGRSIESLSTPYLATFSDVLEIGRHPRGGPGQTCLTLPDHSVSGLHARIMRDPEAFETFVIEDLGSTNGTFIDGVPITTPTPLHDGSVLFLGSEALIFRLLTPSELSAVWREAARAFARLPTLSPTLALTTEGLRTLALSGTEILLSGEIGVGKEVFAEFVHDVSGRKGKFIAVNATDIPPHLLESELFGYRSAHPTATARADEMGLIELASGGTLFLDEIEAVSIDLQSRLLRLGRDRRFTPRGATKAIEIEVQIIAGSSRVGLDDVTGAKGTPPAWFATRPIVLPPLRERIEDIGRLAAYFLERFTSSGTLLATPVFDPDAFRALLLYRWPLNVRELSRVVTEAAVMSGGGSIEPDHLPDAIACGWRAA